MRLTYDQDKDYNSLAAMFVMVAILTGTLVFALRSVSIENEDLKAQITSLVNQRDAARIALAKKEGLISRYVERFSAVQDEIQAIEAKRAAEAKKAADKKARAEFVRNEISCLADNIYREAAYEPENGQLAVATVTMNRVADPYYPKTVCGVVYERHIKKDSDKIVCMFSWTCKPKGTIHPSIYQRVLAMARAVYFKHERNEDVADATLYHASYIKYPNWADPDNLVATIGQHLFYKQ